MTSQAIGTLTTFADQDFILSSGEYEHGVSELQDVSKVEQAQVLNEFLQKFSQNRHWILDKSLNAEIGKNKRLSAELLLPIVGRSQRGNVIFLGLKTLSGDGQLDLGEWQSKEDYIIKNFDQGGYAGLCVYLKHTSLAGDQMTLDEDVKTRIKELWGTDPIVSSLLQEPSTSPKPEQPTASIDLQTEKKSPETEKSQIILTEEEVKDQGSAKPASSETTSRSGLFPPHKKRYKITAENILIATQNIQGIESALSIRETVIDHYAKDGGLTGELLIQELDSHIQEIQKFVAGLTDQRVLFEDPANPSKESTKILGDTILLLQNCEAVLAKAQRLKESHQN